MTLTCSLLTACAQTRATAATEEARLNLFEDAASEAGLQRLTANKLKPSSQTHQGQHQ
jgi:hypothetical protein